MPHLTTRGDIIREVARRWRIKKDSGSSSAPLLITYDEGTADTDSDAVEELTMTLSELPPAEVRASLQEAGIEVSDDIDVNVAL